MADPRRCRLCVGGTNLGVFTFLGIALRSTGHCSLSCRRLPPDQSARTLPPDGPPRYSPVQSEAQGGRTGLGRALSLLYGRGGLYFVCPFCLADPNLQEQDRFHFYRGPAARRSHIHGKHGSYINSLSPLSCPYRDCQLKLDCGDRYTPEWQKQQYEGLWVHTHFIQGHTTG